MVLTQERYFLDTSIWIDFAEDRVGFKGEPLGEYTFRLITKIKNSGDRLVISDIVLSELENHFSLEKINGIFRSFENILDKIITTKGQKEEAKIISINRSVPRSDVLHAIIARDNGLILIARDNHFRQLQDICIFFKPESLI